MKKAVFLVLFLVIANEAIVEAVIPCIITPDCSRVTPPAPRGCKYICAGSKCYMACPPPAAVTCGSQKDCALFSPHDCFYEGRVNETCVMEYHRND